MNYNVTLRIGAVLLIGMGTVESSAQAGGKDVLFKADNGAVIVWDKHAHTIRTPYSQSVKLADCSDVFQNCFAGGDGFAFSYFKNCNDISYKKLRFSPKIVSAIGNDFWIVFDTAPTYMFHYLVPKGIVGIYVGPRRSFDFRALFRDRNLRMGNFDSMEYRLTGSDTIAACSESPAKGTKRANGRGH